MNWPISWVIVMSDRFETRMDELLATAKPVAGSNATSFEPSLSDDQYFPFAPEQLTFQEMVAAVGQDDVGQAFVRNTVGEPRYKKPYRISDKTVSSGKRRKKKGKRPLLWEEAQQLFPAPTSIRPWTKHVALYSHKNSAMLSTRMMSNTWRNPVNAQFKRQCLYLNFLPRINGPVIYEHRVPFDDWTSMNHESLLARLRRAKDVFWLTAEREPGFLWFDNALSRGYYLYLTDVAGVPNFSQVWDVKTLLIGSLNSIRNPSQDEPGRFRPYGGSRNWTNLADSTGEEDQGIWEVIAVGPQSPDHLQLEAECIAEGLQYEFVDPYWRSQLGLGFKISNISKELAVELCLSQHLVLTKGALIESG